MKGRVMVAVLVATALAWPAEAAARRVQMNGKGLPATAPLEAEPLTRAQLETCLRQEGEANRLGEELEGHEARMAAQHAEIERLQLDLHRRNIALRIDLPESVAAYNDGIAQQRSRVAAYNAQLPDQIRRVEAYNVVVARFNRECADRAYWEADMLALRQTMSAAR